jgi:LCP family protein required for cell wall assembly
MNQSSSTLQKIILGVILVGIASSLSLGLSGCQDGDQSTGQTTPSVTSSLEPPQTTLSTSTAIEPSTTDFTSSPSSNNGDQPIWGGFLPPNSDPATPIPPPLTDLSLPEDVLVWVLLGSDTEPPFIGRTQAIHLLFIYPRFSKASVVSIPGDLFVYIPGFTMQRINTAYSLGGIETLRETLAYNFGVNPSRFVLAHPGDFQWLVDDIDNIDVTVFYPLPHVCGGIPAGLVSMDGALALCYVSFRDGLDEIGRMRRQQQLLQLIFQKFSRNGNLIRLPTLFASYQGWIKTDLSLTELMGYIPLALNLADSDRIGYYMIGWDEIRLWELPGYTQAKVFLPVREAVTSLLQQAIDDVLEPQPLTDLVATLEMQLTEVNYVSPTPRATITPLPTSTPTNTPTPTITLTPTITPTPNQTQTLQTLTPIATATITPTPNQTQTLQTLTPIATATQTPTSTETQEGYPVQNTSTPGATPTQSGYP